MTCPSLGTGSFIEFSSLSVFALCELEIGGRVKFSNLELNNGEAVIPKLLLSMLLDVAESCGVGDLFVFWDGLLSMLSMEQFQIPIFYKKLKFLFEI